ncbi:hypothetical protein CT676_38030 [Bradyrhizobium sp. MOS001]|uniref:hypothetical protein n=1 Tax=Bradyrhizobium TaxID=374 RepID=UPI001074C5EE|nr:hypothetical protein [Bradyrhizobium sp. MOS001]MBP1097511.1 hypothetical protein [Bradyrhizobium japonicum]TFW55935.1 hypothetical protein CT676_38030 [Bradyrhizobium sp. MOS001]
MRPSQFHLRTASPTLFVGPKCRAAIRIFNPLLRYALQQASLEPDVHAIRKLSDLLGPPIPLKGVVLERIDAAFLLTVCEIRPVRSNAELGQLIRALAANGLRLLERDASDIKTEPLFSNAREVWSYQRYPVSVRDRLKIAAALNEGGPQSIIELEERVRPSCDLLAAACSLACEGRVNLNVGDALLGPDTIVSGR